MLCLKKIFFKKQTDHSLKARKKQRKNYCKHLYKNKGRNFFSSLNLSFVKDNKLFRKTVKIFFSNKGNLGQYVTNQTSLTSNKGLLKLLGYTCLPCNLVRICFCFEKGSHYYYYYQFLLCKNTDSNRLSINI